MRVCWTRGALMRVNEGVLEQRGVNEGVLDHRGTNEGVLD